MKVSSRESPAQLLDTGPKDQNLDPEDAASLSRGSPKWPSGDFITLIACVISPAFLASSFSRTPSLRSFRPEPVQSCSCLGRTGSRSAGGCSPARPVSFRVFPERIPNWKARAVDSHTYVQREIGGRPAEWRWCMKFMCGRSKPRLPRDQTTPAGPYSRTQPCRGRRGSSSRSCGWTSQNRWRLRPPNHHQVSCAAQGRRLKSFGSGGMLCDPEWIGAAWVPTSLLPGGKA